MAAMARIQLRPDYSRKIITTSCRTANDLAIVKSKATLSSKPS